MRKTKAQELHDLAIKAYVVKPIPITRNSLYSSFNTPPSGRQKTLLDKLIDVGGLTFFKDYILNQSSLDADYAIGSPTATFTNDTSNTPVYDNGVKILSANHDVLKYVISGNRTSAQESVVIKFIPLLTSFSNDGVTRNLLDSDTKRNLIQKGTASTTLKFYPNATDSGTSVTETTTSFLVNTSYVLTTVAYGAIAGTNSAVAVNGTGEASNTTNYIEPVWGTSFYIGSSNTPDKQINGTIQRVAIFNKALTTLEASYITTLFG